MIRMTTTGPDERSELLAAAGELNRQLAAIREGQGDQFVNLAKSAGRARRTAWIAGIVSMVAMLICLMAGFALAGVYQNANRIQQVTERLERGSTITRQNALCPLYEIFLDADTPEARAEAKDKKAYDEAFSVIHEGYDALQCDTPIDPGPPVLGGGLTKASGDR